MSSSGTRSRLLEAGNEPRMLRTASSMPSLASPEGIKRTVQLRSCHTALLERCCTAISRATRSPGSGTNQQTAEATSIRSAWIHPPLTLGGAPLTSVLPDSPLNPDPLRQAHQGRAAPAVASLHPDLTAPAPRASGSSPSPDKPFSRPGGHGRRPASGLTETPVAQCQRASAPPATRCAVHVGAASSFADERPYGRAGCRVPGWPAGHRDPCSASHTLPERPSRHRSSRLAPVCPS